MDNPSPSFCFAPLFGIALGITVAVAAVELIPPDWRYSWQNTYISRSISLQATIVFWCTAIAIRGKRLHCGGTADATTADKHKYVYICLAMIAGLSLSVYGYSQASEALFFVPFILTLLAAASEVGWGKADFMIRERWN